MNIRDEIKACIEQPNDVDRLEALRIRLGDWPTCAVGELHKMYPWIVRVNEHNGSPLDEVLDDLGVSLYYCVREARDYANIRLQQLTQALKIHDGILERVEFLAQEDE